MDLIKQYISQSISSAANNLRLNSQQIEVVALLRQHINNASDLKKDFSEMKKITELSTLAIRLNEILSYLTSGNIDLLKFSDKFKEHCQYLIRDIGHFLEMVNPTTLRAALAKVKEAATPPPVIEPVVQENQVNYDLTKKNHVPFYSEKSESEKVKERFILDDEPAEEDISFVNFEDTILKPIKPIDALLRDLQKNEFETDELIEFAEIMKSNGSLSEKVGFEIIASMHRIIARSLLLIKNRELMPGKDVIDSIRACLIVIVAVVKSKEVDITSYLNRAEDFGRKIQNIKLRDLT